MFCSTLYAAEEDCYVLLDKAQDRVIQMKAVGQQFHAALLRILHKMVLTLNSVDETLVWDHANESYWGFIFLCGTVCYSVQGGSNSKIVVETLVCDHLNESYWAVLQCDTS